MGFLDGKFRGFIQVILRLMSEDLYSGDGLDSWASLD